MSKSRIPTWASLILVGVGLLIAGIPGLFVYMKVTAKKVHHASQDIPSMMESSPPEKWAGATEQARQIVRTSMSENNLAGLSVAVGIDGKLVQWTAFVIAGTAVDVRIVVGENRVIAASAGQRVRPAAAVELIVVAVTDDQIAA